MPFFERSRFFEAAEGSAPFEIALDPGPRSVLVGRPQT